MGKADELLTRSITREREVLEPLSWGTKACRDLMPTAWRRAGTGERKRRYRHTVTS